MVRIIGQALQPMAEPKTHKKWKNDPEHIKAQTLRKQRWYSELIKISTPNEAHQYEPPPQRLFYRVKGGQLASGEFRNVMIIFQ